MLTSFGTALTALNANSTALDVVSNNLANLQTNGFKANTVNFSDLVSETMDADGATQIGLGVQNPTTAKSFTQGAIQGGGGPLDVAINGTGFLVVKNGQGAQEYTRNGSLQADKNGYLVSPTGERVQGWSGINTLGPIGDIKVPAGMVRPATASTNVNVLGNLDATTATAGAYTQPLQAYDSLGNVHNLELTFTKASANTWNVGVTDPTGSSTAALSSALTLHFNSAGQLLKPGSATVLYSAADDPSASTINLTALTDSASPITMNLNLASNPNSIMTQLATDSGVTVQPDGNAAAKSTEVSIANGGVVQVQYSDGTTQQVGQLAMANFQNPQSLISVGDNNFQTSGASSAATIGLPGATGLGQIQGQSKESSTVDIATEFTHLMSYQNSYQAASKVITTSNTILQSTIQLIT